MVAHFSFSSHACSCCPEWFTYSSRRSSPPQSSFVRFIIHWRRKLRCQYWISFGRGLMLFLCSRQSHLQHQQHELWEHINLLMLRKRQVKFSWKWFCKNIKLNFWGVLADFTHKFLQNKLQLFWRIFIELFFYRIVTTGKQLLHGNIESHKQFIRWDVIRSSTYFDIYFLTLFTIKYYHIKFALR